ncbi:MAG: Glycosyltransferase, partial [Porphyrobacter sp. HL-46]
TRACEYGWEAINQIVADTYVRLVKNRRALQEREAQAA